MHISASPMPSILGITEEVLLSGGAAEAHLQPGVYVVDLDRGTVSSQEAHPISHHVLPVELGAKLVTAVAEAVAGERQREREEEQSSKAAATTRGGTGEGAAKTADADAATADASRPGDALSAPFMAFLVEALGPFVGPKLRFDREKCLRTVDRSAALFMDRLMKTQSFFELEEKRDSLKVLRSQWIARRWRKNGVTTSAPKKS